MTAKPKSSRARPQQAANGASFNEGFGKAMTGYSQFAEFNRQAIDAWLESTNIASKGIETLNSETVAFSKQSFEDGVAAAKAALGARNVQELLEIQSDFAKVAFDSYLGQVNRFSDLVAETTKEAVAPLNERFNALVGLAERS
jgi:phasin family protein